MSFRELNEAIEFVWSIWNSCEIVGKAGLQMLSELDSDRSKILTVTTDSLSRFAWNERYGVSSLKFKKNQQYLSIAFYTSRNLGQSHSERSEATDADMQKC